ncbi:hypothetical protein MRA01_64810 [Methylobacterium radiotolerans]|nr:hypothetical protein MRA01_64810 [Methylobacterium radiotolerans]
MPSYLGVESIVYEATDSAGFGPGSNEAGIVIYKIGTYSYNNIKNGGADYLNKQIPPLDEQGRRTRKYHWNVTPGNFCAIKPRPQEQHSSRCSSDALSFAGAYLPSFSPPKNLVDIANSAINSPGNYYAYFRSAFIILDMDNRYAIFVYSG